MDKEEKREGGEGEDPKRLSAEQRILQDEEEDKPKERGVKFASAHIKDSTLENENASDVSESSEVIRNQFKEIYGESDEYDEMGEGEEEEEEEGEEEETSEEEDLSEFKLRLEDKYMKGVEFSEEYLKKENQKIEDVPLQLYAIEIYINSIRTFYGYSNHWMRLKIFDSPCFEIRPCNKVNAQASLYANRSINMSKGSIYENENKRFGKKEVVETEIMAQKRKIMMNKRLDFDLTNMNERDRRFTINRLMRDELMHSGLDFIRKSNLKIPSTEKEVGLDIPMMELIGDEEVKVTPRDERRDSKTLILREPLENGKTIMFPMRPAQLIHQLQRQPLRMHVLSTSGLTSSGELVLSGLTEAVIRASKGPPYPISSNQRFKLITSGEFTAKVVGTVRVIAIGPQNVSKIICEGNINDQVARQMPRRAKHPIIACNMDTQEDKPSILTGPQKFTLYDVVKNIRKRKQREKYQPPPKPAPKRYRVEDLVFNRSKNMVIRAPKKTYVSLRAEIDRYLVLNKPRKSRLRGSVTEEESVRSLIEYEDEVSTLDKEGEEEQGTEEEHDETHEGEKTAQRVEAVFHSLIQVYGQNWANYKPKTLPSSSTSMIHERMPMKKVDSKNSFSSSPIWKRCRDTNSERGKQ